MPPNLLSASLAGSLLLSGCTLAGPVSMGNGNADPSPAVHWCGALNLSDSAIQGARVGGLSDLAYDDRTHTLYLLSDRGYLFQGRLSFDDNNHLTGLNLDRAYPLTDIDGKPLTTGQADAEGMALVSRLHGGKALLIGLELNDRLQLFSLEGRALGPPIRPDALEGTRYNGGLEAVTYHPDYGVISGLERPPSGMPARTTRLFDLQGHLWRYQLADISGSSLTALAPLGHDLLAIERAFAPPRPLAISLRRIHLEPDGNTTTSSLATLYSSEGWLLDNFEGLTRIGANRYLMISDDNFSRWQASLLTCMDVSSP